MIDMLRVSYGHTRKRTSSHLPGIFVVLWYTFASIDHKGWICFCCLASLYVRVCVLEVNLKFREIDMPTFITHIKNQVGTSVS